MTGQIEQRRTPETETCFRTGAPKKPAAADSSGPAVVGYLRAWLSLSHSLPIDVIQLCPVRAMTLGGAFYWLEAQPLYPSIIVRTALAENGLPFLLT